MSQCESLPCSRTSLTDVLPQVRVLTSQDEDFHAQGSCGGRRFHRRFCARHRSLQEERRAAAGARRLPATARLRTTRLRTTTRLRAATGLRAAAGLWTAAAGLPAAARLRA